QAFIDAVEPVSKDPILKTVFGSTETYDEAFSMGEQYAQLGMRRLSPDMLRQRSEIYLMLLDRSDTVLCGKLAKGSTSKSDQASFFKVLDSLPAQQVKRWFDISTTAMKAEAQKYPPSATLTDAQIDQAYLALTAKYTAAQRDDLILLLQSPSTVSNEKACEVVRTIYRSALNIPNQQQANLVFQALVLD